MNIDEKMMLRCINLAQLGRERVSPNPMVGALLAIEDRIIAEGYHRGVGTAHAEVAAIESVKDRKLLEKATLYANLEPCNHQGTTPPCTEEILQKGIKKVVFGSQDTNPKVKGKGYDFLKKHNVKVSKGILEKKCNSLNKRFFTYCNQKRPYIILKWASSSDNFINNAKKEREIISGKDAQWLLHQWRAQEDAVLVGRKTMEIDMPKLNIRYYKTHPKKKLLRLIVGSCPTTPIKGNLFDGSQKTIYYNDKKEEITPWGEYKKIKTIEDILKDLYHRKILSLLIEGGNITLQRWIDTGLWDEARVFSNNTKKIYQGVPAPHLLGGIVKKRIALENDTLSIYYKSKP